MELNELRKVAESATPGPWSTVDANVVQVPNFPDGDWVVDCPNPSEVDHINAEYIATFDPPTVLALMSRLEQAEQDRVKLRNRLDAMRRQRDGYRNQLRKAEQQVQNVRELHSITFYDKWARTSLEPVGHGGWCSNCGRFDGDSCPTIRALDGEPNE